MYKPYTYTVILFLLLLGSWALPTHAQLKEQLPLFRYYTTKDGLLSNTVFSITQDKRGYLWFGTSDGLSRFDAYQFKNYLKLDPTQQLTSHITAMYAYDKDHFYVADQKKVYTYHYATAKFLPIKTLNESIEKKILCINGTPTELWIGLEDGGIIKYNTQTASIQSYPVPQVVVHLFLDFKGSILAINRHGKIYHYVLESDHFEEIPLEKSPQSNAYITCAMMDLEGDIWMGDWQNGLYEVDLKTRKITQYPLQFDGRRIERIHSIIPYTDQQMMIGSDDGLTVFETKTGEHYTIKENKYPGDNRGLNNRFVYPLYKAENGGIWIGTFFGGVNYLSTNNVLFKTGIYPPEVTTSHVVSKFHEDQEGIIWIGTDDKGLLRFDPNTREVTSKVLDWPNEPLNIHAIASYLDTLWIGTYQKGIYRYLPRINQVHHYKELVSIYEIHITKKNNLWAGTPDGLFLLDRNDNTFKLYPRTVSIKGIERIMEDTKNRLWIVSNSHILTCFDPEKETVTHFTEKIKAAGVLEGISTIHIDQDDLWIGTKRYGLYKFDLANNSISKADVQTDLLETTVIQYITHTPGRYLWLTTSIGLFRYHTQSHHLQYFNSDDGLLSENFNHNAGLQTRDQLIFLGKHQGFNYFNPLEASEDLPERTIILTDFQFVQGGDMESIPLEKEEIILSHLKNTFKIQFSSMNYASPKKSRYRYKLEGFDQEFIETGLNEANYSNLPPGKYNFKVAYLQETGGWSDPQIHLPIHVLAPWWQTNTMKIIYGFLLCIILYVLIQYLRRKNRLQEMERLEVIQRANEQKINEAKMTFFTQIAHEIRTPASLISAPIETLLMKESIPEPFMEDLHIIKNNSDRLINLIDQVLDLHHVDHGYTNIYNEYTEIAPFIQNRILPFKPYCQTKDIQLYFHCDNPEGLNGPIDQDIVHKIITNVLSNAVKFTHDRIEVRLSPVQDGFLVEIIDNGQGISKEHLEKIFDPFFTTPSLSRQSLKGFGIGLSLVAKLSEVIGAQMNIKSHPGQGSRFSIQFRFGETNSQPIYPILEGRKDHTLLAQPIPFTLKNVKALPHKDELPTLLVVEDHLELAHYLASFLQDDYNVCVAEDGQKALIVLENKAIDMVISDLSMPVMDGLQLCMHLRQDLRYCHLPLILLTADTNVQSKIEGIGGGADVYLEKPISLTLLKTQIATIFKQRDYLRSLFSENNGHKLSNVASNDRDKKFLDQIESIILEHLADPNFAVDHIAKHMGVSRSGLYAKLSQMSEIPPNELIRVVRLNKAAEFLTNSDHRISEICYLVGFNSPSYFTRSFVRQYGMSPKVYQQKILNELTK
jgi:signal transduction histidine kinase/ligand-binding sensor domain-containing protein/DNA-binding response OmpR family regulator